MRLWHKDFIPVLPRQQLLSQWRECCCIAKNLAENGTPNHLLVNKILNYPPIHFESYCYRVTDEMHRRGYDISKEPFERLQENIQIASRKEVFNRSTIGTLYEGWHNDRYLAQCYYNLQEKYDCGGITKDEWQKIEEVAASRLKEES